MEFRFSRIGGHLDRLVRRLSAGGKPCSRSYAQCGEDLILSFAFYSLGIHRPSYLDIGAHDPEHLSNTALFYERGCNGVNVEPNKHLFARFRSRRPRDVNLNVGVGEIAGFLDFYVMSNPELSTFSRERAESLQGVDNLRIVSVQRVQVQTINRILGDHFPTRPPDLLCVDVEGWDLTILKTLDFARQSPRCICVETADYGCGKRNDGLVEFLCDRGYFVYADTFINTIFFQKAEFERLRSHLRAGTDDPGD